MNITIDCRMLGYSGVGVYLEGCLPKLLDSSHDFLLFGESKKILDLTGIRNNITIEECEIKSFSLAELFSFPKQLLKKINNGDIYYSPYFNIPGGIKVPVFVTIHDIIFPDMPELVSFIGLWSRMYFYRRAFRLSSAIFTVSAFSKSRIEHHLGEKKPIINASNAVNDFFLEALPEKILKRKQILFIGNIKKHKGLSILLDAFLSAREEGFDYELIIIGNKDNFRSGDRESISRLENLENKGVKFTGFISDIEKRRLLAESALLVQPSLYEGFGYPPLEAMMSGTMALISDIPVFREVYGDFPVTFFKAGDSADLKGKMIRLLSDKGLQSIELPVHLKKKYSFKKTAKIVLEKLEKHY